MDGRKKRGRVPNSDKPPRTAEQKRDERDNRVRQLQRAKRGSSFLLVGDVADRCSCSESKAYHIMRQLNKELEAAGKITVAGRLSKRYFEERMY
jgi:hypothetical protein